MARAPQPGAVRQDVEADRVLILSVDGVEQRLVIADLGPKDAVLVRKLRLGVSLAGLLVEVQEEGQADIDVPCILWYLARKKNGENKLTFEQAVQEFPSYADIKDRFTLETDEPEEDDSPEA